jgi:hypothetical protein
MFTVGPVVVIAGLLVAQATGNEEADTVLDWLQYGVLGLIVVAFVTGYIVPKPTVKQLIADRDFAAQQASKDRDATIARIMTDKAAAESARDKFNDINIREVIPAVTDFSRTVTMLLPLLQRLVERELDRDQPSLRDRSSQRRSRDVDDVDR